MSAPKHLLALMVLAASACGGEDPSSGTWPASSAPAAPPTAQTTSAWRKSYRLTIDGAPWKAGLVAETLGGTSDGGFVAVSSFPGGGVLRGLLGLSLSGDGAVRSGWGWRSNARFASVHARHGAVLAGALDDDPTKPTVHAMAVVEIAADGTVLRNNHFDSATFNRIPVVFRMKDGADLVLAGNLVARLAPDGTPLWARSYEIVGRDVVVALQPVEVADGLVVAFADLGLPGPILLAHLSKTGEVDWARKLEVLRDGGHGTSNLAVAEDGRIVACVVVGKGASPAAFVSLAPDGHEGTARELSLGIRGPLESGEFKSGGYPIYLQRSKAGWRCGFTGTRGPENGNVRESLSVELTPDGSLERAVRDKAHHAATAQDSSVVLMEQGGGELAFLVSHPAMAEACATPLKATVSAPKPLTVSNLTMNSAPVTLTPRAPLDMVAVTVTGSAQAELCW